jgi:hypothetical protein
MHEVISLFIAALTIAFIVSMLRIGAAENTILKAVAWSVAAAITGSIVILQIMGVLL